MRVLKVADADTYALIPICLSVVMLSCLEPGKVVEVSHMFPMYTPSPCPRNDGSLDFLHPLQLLKLFSLCLTEPSASILAL